jgi:hypothetical protein
LGLQGKLTSIHLQQHLKGAQSKFTNDTIKERTASVHHLSVDNTNKKRDNNIWELAEQAYII